jgi:hypothetical protein
MTLASETARNDYTGDGTDSVFAYTFRIVSQSDLLVQVQEIATGAVTELTITTDYTVDGVGDGSGGDVTLVNDSQAWLDSGNLSSEYTIMIRRNPDRVQNTDIRNQGTFYQEDIEAEFDNSRMIDQAQQDEIDRSVKLPDPILPTTFDPTLPSNITLNPGAALMVNSSGDGFTLSSAVFSFYIQTTQPSDPDSNVLAFWFNTLTKIMYIWCVDEWRAFA